MGFSDLTARERAVLAHLSQGHSVKTAAEQEGISEYAAQELLRSARRKLGVTSSREAARLVTADPARQKICDSKSVMEGLPSRSQSAGIIATGGVMILGLLAGLAAFVSGQADTRSAVSHAEAPKVVATTPANGEAIPAGRFTLSVTYDRPMQRGSMSFATGPEAAYPQCKGKPVQSPDGRTFSITCNARAGHSYVVWFNHGRFMNFRDAATGVSATPHRIAFSARP